MSPYRELLTTYTADLPEVQDIVAMMRAVIDEYDDRMLVGEIYLPLERLMAYYGASGKGAHLPFNFQLIVCPGTPGNRRRGRALRSDAAIVRLAQLGARQSRQAAHRHPGRRAQARVAAMLLLTLRGTPTLYYGDEIGMHDVPIPPDQVRIRSKKTFPVWAWGAIRCAHRCNGPAAMRRLFDGFALAAARR